jgi:ABC-2 type transport system ATP-binding protein
MNKKKILIELKNIFKNYKKNKVLNGINFKLYEGERIAIIGSNGSGKTTICEIISGLKKIDKGEINYNFDQKKMAFYLSIVFQNQKYPEYLSVRDIINLYTSLYKGIINKDEINEMKEQFDINSILNKTINNLSVGQLQRINLFLSLFFKPKIFIGDEITTGLDIYTKIKVLDYLKKEINKNKITILLVSHDWEEINFLCERVVLINKGKIIDNVDVESIKKNYHTFLDYFNNKLKQEEKKE